MKDCIEELALFGGSPSFPEKLHVGRPNLGDRERFLARVNEMFDRNWLTNNGPLVQELEQKLAGMLGVRNCIVLCNATVALEIAVRALGLTGEVIVPSFTFVATAHSLQWQEITPVFCDIDPDTHTLDPQAVRRMITPRTSGIVGVHLWGRPCNVEALTEIAESHNLKLMFDAAHAFGCSHNGKMIGNFGNAEVFSFHATKFFNTFEGGAIVTNSDELAAKIRLMKNFGFAGYDNVIYVGTNGKMTEICAAMGLTGLESLDDFIAVNHRNYRRYSAELADIPGVSLIKYNDKERCNCQYIVLEIDEGKAGLNRDYLVEVLHAENVMARRYFYPGCHRMEPYRSYFPHAELLLPNTERLAQRVMSLPTGTAVDEEDIKAIGRIIRLAVSHGGEITGRLAKTKTGLI
ncbi:aminotransferase class I/II-fold pyridoxal phosphate-dependent enzyme [Oryzomonas rubra]|uniref:Aminotransferase class I/II-fold pyridoxal phosphate-dependent enzyme n=2 Tax=Oryzomonas rubra TaxID=2509454 RepID=A0A5A9XLU1_9BACT|nr:aminotransferase class I/II-fold pyridoxal phosphate-dependent enzyme [Oryzomonas rubra]